MCSSIVDTCSPVSAFLAWKMGLQTPSLFNLRLEITFTPEALESHWKPFVVSPQAFWKAPGQARELCRAGVLATRCDSGGDQAHARQAEPPNQ